MNASLPAPSSANAKTETLFFQKGGLEDASARRVVEQALHGMDDGELFLEYSQSESLVFDDGRLKQSSFNTSRGFGLRAVMGEAAAYAHATDMSAESLKRAAETVRHIQAQPKGGSTPLVHEVHGAPLYIEENPLGAHGFEEKLAVLSGIDSYLRGRDPRVRQVSASLVGVWQAVRIMRADGEVVSDLRPLVRLNIQVVVDSNGRMETGSAGAGGRTLYTPYLSEASWRKQADEALRQALVNLEAVPAPAGEMPVVLGPGWCGVLLHEAVGHGLEGDFNRKGTSNFSGKIGERVAAPGVTVVDRGDIPHLRGSLTVDDEGTPSGETVLIEDGILKAYIQDRLNARLSGVKATGNGRRESFAHAPMPRMTNTYMLAGATPPEEMIASVKRGFYATHFGGGQVDITSGKFVFSASEAYLIENGKVTVPVKGATLIGNGPEVMGRITAIGNDLSLDPGIGTCGKAGQSVPVGVGQPSLLISSMTVGGTEIAA